MIGVFTLFTILFVFNFPVSSKNLKVQDVISDVKNAMDLSVDPCADFYSYSCGGWIKNTTLPPTKSRLSKSFSAVQEGNENILKKIVENKNSGKVNTFYNSCMNMSIIDALGFQPIIPLLDMILEARDQPTDLDALLFLSGELYNEGISTFFSYSAQIDSEDPAMVYGQLDQGGLGLPYPSLYLDNDQSSATIRAQYIQHLTNMFQLIFNDTTAAASAANQTFNVEYAIANFTIPAVDLFDPFSTYNKLTSTQLSALFPEIPRSFFPAIGARGQNLPVLVTVPSFFSNLSQTLDDINYFMPIAVTDYLIWQVLRQKSEFLSQPFRDEHFRFYNTILGGQSQPNPRWMQCVNYIDSSIGELLGNYFVKVAFPEQSRTAAVNLLNGIISAMKDDINSVTWMDSVTRTRALTKLSLVTDFIGSPLNFDNYKSVVVTSDDFYGNVRNSLIYSVQKNLKFIGMFSNQSLMSAWEMTAPTVNAYYEPTKNQMVFPAGILQTPFFDYSFPLEMQIGSIGMVMGHELTHGFDSQGRLYDGTGKLINWWLPATSKLFDTKVGCVIDQYSKFEILPGVFVDGKLTQGENIADMGGIKNAFHLAELLLGVKFDQPSIVPGLTSAQLFFVSFAQIWCDVSSEASIKLRVKTDPHSPGKFRVLGPLINLPKFAEVFQCPVGSFMNPGPGKSCQVW